MRSRFTIYYGAYAPFTHLDLCTDLSVRHVSYATFFGKSQARNRSHLEGDFFAPLWGCIWSVLSIWTLRVDAHRPKSWFLNSPTGLGIVVGHAVNSRTLSKWPARRSRTNFATLCLRQDTAGLREGQGSGFAETSRQVAAEWADQHGVGAVDDSLLRRNQRLNACPLLSGAGPMPLGPGQARFGVSCNNLVLLLLRFASMTQFHTLPARRLCTFHGMVVCHTKRSIGRCK